jgi:hypothetical protein
MPRQALEDSSLRGELQWTDGMLYPLLHRLERNGLVMRGLRASRRTGRTAGLTDFERSDNMTNKASLEERKGSQLVKKGRLFAREKPRRCRARPLHLTMSKAVSAAASPPETARIVIS